MADGQGMPELLEPARRCEEAILKLVQPGGEVEAVASRRQDQDQTAYLSRQAFSFAAWPRSTAIPASPGRRGRDSSG